LNLRKANSVFEEDTTGWNDPDFSRTIPCLTCGIGVPITFLAEKSKRGFELNA
jgi:hypothetical protein